MTRITKAVEWAVRIANDDSHGYDQAERWGVDYDCSSLVISAYEQAGVPVKEAGATYTGNMKQAFMKCGFKDVTKEVTLRTGRKVEKGDVLLNEANHTALAIGDGQIVHASINEKGKITGGKKGDQTGREIYIRKYYNYPWDCVLRLEETEELKSVDEIAKEVIAGKWGNYPERKDRLEAAGYNYETVQSAVNRMLGGGSHIPSSNDAFVGTVATDISPLNIRAEASITSRVVGWLPKGSKVSLYCQNYDGWYKLTDGRGYVCADYIQ